MPHRLISVWRYAAHWLLIHKLRRYRHISDIICKHIHFRRLASAEHVDEKVATFTAFCLLMLDLVQAAYCFP